jgi:uncharacterized surface protein with fasciclin (FAS1) repeats
MKKKFLNVLPLFLLCFSLIFTVSCSDDSDSTLEDSTRISIYELLDYDSTQNRPPNNPGDDPIALIAINGGFNELVDALVYVDTELDAGLVDLFLNGTDQYTVFAPNDMAFMNLYSALGITDITDLPAELVLDVLLYHVTDGRRASNSVVPKRNPKTITTLLGATFQVTNEAEIIAIGNTANILAADISASNGVIHVISEVILPIE